MYHMHMALGLELIALVAGTFLLLWIKKNAVDCKFSKIIGAVVVVVALLSLVCTTLCGFGCCPGKGKKQCGFRHDKMPRHEQAETLPETAPSH